MRKSLIVSRSLPTYQYLIYFRSERKYFNSLASTAAVIDILEEKYGICYNSPNIGKRYQTEKLFDETIPSWQILNICFDRAKYGNCKFQKHVYCPRLSRLIKVHYNANFRVKLILLSWCPAFFLLCLASHARFVKLKKKNIFMYSTKWIYLARIKCRYSSRIDHGKLIKHPYFLKAWNKTFTSGKFAFQASIWTMH